MEKVLIGRNGLENIIKANDIAGNIEALTNSEGRHILSHKNIDALRTASAAAASRLGIQAGPGGVQGLEVGPSFQAAQKT